MVKCLIDGDVLTYQYGWVGQHKDGDGGWTYSPFSEIADLLDHQIHIIQEECMATEPTTIYFTGDEKLVREDFKPNFRYNAAKTKPYKGTRKSEKPWHYDNIRAYLLASYDCHVSNGYEADDAICMALSANPGSIACSVDKDLRQVEGMHFTWKVGERPADGPTQVSQLGELWWEGNKLRGNGDKFLYCQMLTGDTVDNIPGLPQCGPKKAYEALASLGSREELESACRALYEASGLSEEYWQEQWNLLYIWRTEEDGKTLGGINPL